MSKNNKVEKIKVRAVALIDRIRVFFSPPKRKPVAWIVGEEATPPESTPSRSVWEVFAGFTAFWGRIRTRVLRASAGVLALVNLALAVVLYSNIWYMNLILWAVTVPQFLILIHYLRLTRNV